MADKSDSDDEDIILIAALAAVAAGIECITAAKNELQSTSSDTSDNLSLISSGSTGRTRQNANRSRELVDQSDNISSQIGGAIDSNKKRDKKISSTLHSEIMKSESYDEEALGKAFDYLLKHEKHAIMAI